MSYTKHYREVVSTTVSKRVSVNYPASQNGGSTSVSVDFYAEIPVDVNIHVDTVPFDNGVVNCGTNVNLLTASVVATEAAEIVSRKKNAQKVADSVIGGFFGYIRSEISQQTAELSQNFSAHLMHLKELAQSCLSKKNQMEADYNRITSRYIKVFEDLNNELSNRIYELDKPAFVFRKGSDKHEMRKYENDLITTVSVFGAEGLGLQSKIKASYTKMAALNTISKAKAFISQQNHLSTTIKKCIIDDDKESLVYSPICYVEMSTDQGNLERKIYGSQVNSKFHKRVQDRNMFNNFLSDPIKWRKLSSEEFNNIKACFNSELNNRISDNGKHSMRVREMIQKIASFNSLHTSTC